MEPLTAGDPARVGGFVLRGRLGAGGMGEVFLGRSPGGRAAAVKVVHAHLARQPQFRHRFRREVAAARSVSGAYTAPVMAAGPEDNPPWIATLYVPGPSLADALAAAGPLPEDSAWPLAAGLVEALQAIHAEKLLHRDLTPSNVLLAADGPRVIDFGISRALDGTVLTGTGAAIGTPGFMSPEQAEDGEVRQASDVFSFGAVLAYAAGGVEPFGHGPPLGILHRVVTAEPRLDAVPERIRALVAACLAKNPDDRPTPAELLDLIAADWDPGDGFPTASPWPETVTALIRARAVPAAARDTETHTDAETGTAPLPHVAPTLPAPPRYVPTLPVAQPPETNPSPAPAPAGSGRPPKADRPRALRRRHRHAIGVKRSGDFVAAERLLVELVADRSRVQGPDHPDVLYTRQHHAVLLLDMKRYAEAARLLADVVPAFLRLRGPHHPDSLLVRQQYAEALGDAGEQEEAARVLADLLPDHVRALGPYHPDTLALRDWHARCLSAAGQHEEAAQAYAELLAERARALRETGRRPHPRPAP